MAYKPLKIGATVKLKIGVKSCDVSFSAGTTGRVAVPSLPDGNVGVDIYLFDQGTKRYIIERSNLRLVSDRRPKKAAMPKRNPASVGVSDLPKGYDLLTPSERALLSRDSVEALATSLANQRRAKQAMLDAIETYANCTANVSHARRIANKKSGLT